MQRNEWTLFNKDMQIILKYLINIYFLKFNFCRLSDIRFYEWLDGNNFNNVVSHRRRRSLSGHQPAVKRQ
jgi:hypothetical protein